MFIVIDVESTCGIGVDRDKSEIIEIGYVLVSVPGQKLHVNYTFVRPVLNPILTDFCKDLTHISQNDVDNAVKYPDAITKMSNDVYSVSGSSMSNCVMCSWGDYDREMFIQCGKQHGLSDEFPFFGHVNLKREWALANGLKVKGMGLKKALEYSGMSFEGSPHRGVDDALNIANLMGRQWPGKFTGMMKLL